MRGSFLLAPSKMSERWEWVEILEPQTKQWIYANLTTGECVWEPPPGVRMTSVYTSSSRTSTSLRTKPLRRPTPIQQKKGRASNKRTDQRSQWWELFDEKTSRFYYYDAMTQKTAWHRPTNCNIIPLAKLQTLKQNTTVREDQWDAESRSRPAEKREISTQTTPIVSSVPQLRPKSQKMPGSRSMRSQSTSEDQGVRSHSSVHMAQSSRCLGYQHNRSQKLMQPFSDGGDSSLSSGTSCAKRFSPHLPFRDPQDHGFEVGSNGQSAQFSGDNLTDDSPIGSPPNPWQQSSRLHDEDVGATYDDPADFFGDLSGSLYEDLLQIASFHPPPPQPKTRTFPRTNPSCVAPHYRNLSCDYEKSSPEHRPVPKVSSTSAVNSSLSQLSQSYLGSAAFDRKGVVHHERPDSDISYSSFGIGCLQHDTKDSQASQSSSRVQCPDSLTDILSSLGILNEATISVSGSKSSARYNNERYGCAKVSPLSSSSSHSSPCRTTNVDSNFHHLVKQTSERLPSTETRTRRNSEPDYANLPMATQLATETSSRKPAGNSLSLSDKLRAVARYDDGNGMSFSSPSKTCSVTAFSRKEYLPRFGRLVFIQNSEESVELDSETSSVLSSPLFEPWRSLDSACEVQKQPCTLEASMKAIGKSKSLDVDDRLVPPLSVFSSSRSDEHWNIDHTKKNGLNQTGIEQFALANFNEHRHGILGKTVPIGNMLTWTKDVIGKPMIRTQDKVVKKEAPEVFRLIQMYMSDRKAKSPQMQVALEIVQKGWSIIELRDEIYMQLCRQTTENPKEESLIRGWELMGICLSVFPPSSRFHSYLERYLCHHLNLDESKTLIIHFAGHCQRQLDRTSKRGAKGSSFKLTIDFVEQTVKSIFHPSNFGGTLEDIMQIQRDRFPDRQLPWIQTTLSEEVLRLNGVQTEGIFRVSGDTDEVNALRTYSDQWNVPNSSTDLHALASLLKQWYRELYEPLIPSEFYDDCIASWSDPDAAIAVVERLPSINRLVFCYLIRFLQVFAASENASVSKMDASNLATVMAPNCLRCESDDPNVILKNAQKEAGFIKMLILNLDTSFMDGVW